MKIEYAVSGASIDSGGDYGDFNWVKTLKGTVSGKTVTFSGTVTGYNSKFPTGEWASTSNVGVSATAGSNHKEQSFKSTDDAPVAGATWVKPFSVTVEVPRNAETVTLSVSESTSYGNGETRGLGVSGTFTNPSYDPNAKEGGSPLDSLPFTGSNGNSGSSGGDEGGLPVVPIAAAAAIVVGAVIVKVVTGKKTPPEKPALPYVPSDAEVNPDIPGIENDPDAEIFTTPTPDGEQQQIVNKTLGDLDAEDIEKLTKKDWDKTSLEDKEKFIKKLQEKLAKELGVKNPPPIVIKTPPDYCDQRAGGWFDPNTGELGLNPNSDTLDTPANVISVLGHEMKHSQQKDPNNPMETAGARKIADKNFTNYTESTKDLTRYQKQYVERDANAFGKKLADTTSKAAYTKKLDNLADLINQLKPDPKPPAHGGFDTIDKIKKDPGGFLDHLTKNPDQKEKFIQTVRQNARRMAGGR